jgi:hypothetical protein
MQDSKIFVDYWYFFIITDALWPPKPKVLLNAALTNLFTEMGLIIPFLLCKLNFL